MIRGFKASEYSRYEKLVYYEIYTCSSRIVGDDFRVLKDDERIVENYLKRTGYEVTFLRVREKLISLGEV